MILRVRRFYGKEVLLRFYKSFVLSYLEFGTRAVYYVTDYALSLLDRVQERILTELQISETDGICQYSLAPLRCRRDIAMLGLLHRINRTWARQVFGKFV